MKTMLGFTYDPYEWIQIQINGSKMPFDTLHPLYLQLYISFATKKDIGEAQSGLTGPRLLPQSLHFPLTESLLKPDSDTTCGGALR